MARKETLSAAKPAQKAAMPRTTALSTKAATAPQKTTSKTVGKAVVGKAVAKTAAAPARGGAKAAAIAKVAAVAKPVTVTLKHLAAGLSESRGIPKRDAEAFAVALIGDLVNQVKGGAKVRIAGLGVIGVKDSPARMARNPATGQPVQVEASRKIVFRVAKELKEAI